MSAEATMGDVTMANEVDEPGGSERIDEPRCSEAVQSSSEAAPRSRMGALLGNDGGWTAAFARAGVGLGLSATFGLAMGAREGGVSLLHHALGVTAAPASILALGVPSLHIVLTLFDAPVGALDLARCAARGVAAFGVVLAGLAPLSALYVVSGASDVSGGIVSLAGLIAAGFVAIARFHSAFRDRVRDADASSRATATLATSAFALFATIAAARIWFGELPLLGGGS